MRLCAGLDEFGSGGGGGEVAEDLGSAKEERVGVVLCKSKQVSALSSGRVEMEAYRDDVVDRALLGQSCQFGFRFADGLPPHHPESARELPQVSLLERQAMLAFKHLPSLVRLRLDPVEDDDDLEAGVEELEQLREDTRELEVERERVGGAELLTEARTKC